MTRILLAALAFAVAFCGGTFVANSQTNPGFNPNLQWCGVQGSVAIRGASNWQCLLPGTNGQALLSGGAGANPSWSTLTGTGTVTSVQAAGGSTGLSFSGGPITGAGTLTLGGTLAIGSGGTGGTGAANTVFRSDGVNNAFGQIVLGDLANAAVNNANIVVGSITPNRLANFPALTVLANITGGSAAPTTSTVTALLDAAFSSVQGSVLYRNSGGWAAIGPGSAGEFLKTNGAAANPQWSAVSGASGGTVTSVTCNSGLTGGTFTVTGTCAIDAGNVPGIAGNTVAAAGKVGEVVSANLPPASQILPASGIIVNVVSIVLTAGDWDISAIGYESIATTTTSSGASCAISTTSAVLGNEPFLSQFGGSIAGSNQISRTLVIPPQQILLNAPTTYYLNCGAGWTGGPGVGVYGNLRARRMR